MYFSSSKGPRRDKILPNSVIEGKIALIDKSEFTTFDVTNLIIGTDKGDEMQSEFPRNWRAETGKAIKRYANETQRIKQISVPENSPAVWKKIAQ